MNRENILLFEPDKKVEKLFTGWLKEKDYGVRPANNIEQIPALLSGEKFDILIIDIDSSEITKSLLKLLPTLKEDTRFSDLPVAVLTDRKDVKKIVSAIESGADFFLLKPFEADSFLKRLEIIFKEIELKSKGKRVLDLNYINYLIVLSSEMERENLFILSTIIFNKLIIEKINTILGESIIAQIIKRVNEIIGEDYAFMREVKFSGAQILMESVDKASKDIPVVKLTIAFRDYIYAFLQLVQTLTSDILMERWGGVLKLKDK